MRLNSNRYFRILLLTFAFVSLCGLSARAVASWLVLGNPVPGITEYRGFFNEIRTDKDTGAKRPHAALDLSAPAGTPVVAPAAGTVVYAGWSKGCGDMRGKTTCPEHKAGYVVVIDHGGGYYTKQSHLQYVPVVGVGQEVEAGAYIGFSGDTGSKGKYHLDTKVYLGCDPDRIATDDSCSDGLKLDPMDHMENPEDFTCTSKTGCDGDNYTGCPRNKFMCDDSTPPGDGSDGGGGSAGIDDDYPILCPECTDVSDLTCPMCHSPGGDHPDDTFSVADAVFPATPIDFEETAYRLAPKKGKALVINYHNFKRLIKERDSYIEGLGNAVPDQAYLAELDAHIHALYDSFGTGQELFWRERAAIPDEAVLLNGFGQGAAALLTNFNELALGAPMGFSPERLSDQPVLVIPSAGLYGMENSTFFKAALDEYVKRGGTLVVFAQQRGYEFSVLPTPDNKPVTGYGWTEDQSCFTNAVYIDTYSQILSGQSRSTPTLSVDGYFTSYPEDSTVILRRTKNGQPAMISYPHGEGRVIATTMYSDWAFGHGQASTEEIALVRDLLSWAKAPAELPEVTPGQSASLSLSIVNLTDINAASIKLSVLDPSRNVIIEQTVSGAITAGGTSTIPYTYATAADAPLGIWHVDYALLDAEGNVIQPLAETDSGRFVVSRPPENPYESPDFNFSVQSNSEYYFYGSTATFTFNLWNNTDADRELKVTWGLPHHRFGWDSHFDKTVTVPANGNINFTYVLDSVIDLDRLRAIVYDAAGNRVGYAEKGIFMYRPSVNVSVETDKAEYGRTDTVNLSLNFKNRLSSEYAATVKVMVTDSLNLTVYTDAVEVNLPPTGMVNQSLSFPLPPTGPVGFYNIFAEVYDSTGAKIGGDATFFEVPSGVLALTPLLPPAFGEQTDIAFKVENVGFLEVTSSEFTVSLKDPGGIEVWTASRALSNFMPEEVRVLDFSLSVPPVAFGDYKLYYGVSFEGRARTDEVTIPSSAAPAVSLDRPSYGARESANITMDVTNTGGFDLDGLSVNVSVPDAGYSDIKTISILSGETSEAAFTFAIPATVNPGQHGVDITLSLPSGSTVSKSLAFNVPESKLVIKGPDTGTFSVGDTIELTIENIGGVDTDYTSETLSLLDDKGVLIYEGSVSGSVMAGEERLLKDIQLPSQTVTGSVTISARIKDVKTGILARLYSTIEINGLTADLTSATDKEVFLETEDVTVTTTLANGLFDMEGAAIDLKVVQYGGPADITSGEFSHFAPKKETGWWPFWHPESVAVGPDGMVYVLDGQYQFPKVQVFDSDGNFIKEWGEYGYDDGQIYDPRGIAVGPDGSVYVTDDKGFRVQKFDSSGNFIAKWGGYCRVSRYYPCEGKFRDPTEIAVSHDGFVYVVDKGNYRIQKFDSNGDFITQWGKKSYYGGDGTFYLIESIAVGPDGSVYVSHYSKRGTYIQKFDADGNFIMKWGGVRGSEDGEFNFTPYLSVSPDGLVYASDVLNKRVQVFDENGNFLRKFENEQPYNIAFSPDGFLYLLQQYSLQKLDENGGLIKKLGRMFTSPSTVAVGPDGSTFVPDNLRRKILKFDRDGNFVTEWGSLCKAYSSWSGSTLIEQCDGGGFYSVVAMDFDSQGFLYVLDSYNNSVQKFHDDGSFVSAWSIGRGSGDGQLYHPLDMTFDSDDIAYIADSDNKRVQKFDRDGNFLGKWGEDGTGEGQFKRPSGVAIDPSGAVYVLDRSNSNVQKFDANGNFILGWGGYCETDPDWDRVRDEPCDGSFAGPEEIAVNSNGLVYVTETWNNRVQLFDGDGGLMAKWEFEYSRDDGQFKDPVGIDVGPDDSVYATDWNNFRIQKMTLPTGGSTTLFEATIPVDQATSTTEEYVTEVGAFGVTGKLYLEATLTNSLGQVIAEDEYPFYIVAGDTVLLFNTDKEAYKPGETVSITGEVRNLAGVSLDNAALTISSGADMLLSETVTVPATGSHSFSVETTAGGEGTVTLTGTVVQNGSTLVEITDQYEVSNPVLSVVMTAPDVVGKDPFAINVVLKNDGKVDIVIQYSLSGGALSDTGELTIGAGEERLLQYTGQITGSVNYTFSITGDKEETLSKLVVYGEAAEVTLGAEATYPEGMVGVPVTITNTGTLGEELDVSFVLSSGSGVINEETRTYYLPEGGSLNDTLYYDVTEGDYTVSATAPLPEASADAGFSVLVREDVIMEATIVDTAEASEGLIPVSAEVVNAGYDGFSGSVVLSTSFWSGEVEVELASGESTEEVFNVNPAAAEPGTYELKVALYDTAGREISMSTLELVIQGPTFELTEVPPYTTFNAGTEGGLAFIIKNTGSQEGEASLNLKVMDVLDHTIVEWLKPGEEKTFDFAFLLPDDIEEKDYFADYSLSGTEDGQVRFHVTGVNISVDSALDRDNYAEGDTAVLTLEVTDNATDTGDAESTNLFARVNYNGYEETRPFTLVDVETLAFEVPLSEITGEKLFYGIYHESGRSIHLNTLYVYEAGEGITVTTDKQVYEPGDSVSISLSGEATGQMTLTGPGGYTETFDFTGTATRGFTLPQAMTAGTYLIGYTVTTPGGETLSGSHSIDVAGIQVKVTEATLDKARYASTDTMELALTIVSNEDLNAELKTWVVDPTGGYTSAGSTGVGLTSTENLLATISASLSTETLGIHRLVYAIYSDGLLLVSGAEAFDVGSAVLFGVSTDKSDYPGADETIKVASSLFGTVSGTLEFFIDGEAVDMETVSLAGFETHIKPLTDVVPGVHTLKVVLTSGGLSSTKSTGFVYGSALPDLTIGYLGAERDGTVYSLETTVVNSGKTASTATTVAIYYGDGDGLVTTLGVPALAPNESVTMTYDWNLLGLAGEHSIRVVVDYSNNVLEFNEGNNTRSIDVTVPALILQVSTTAPEYGANEHVGVTTEMANMTSSTLYEGLTLSTVITGPEGNTLFDEADAAPALTPASLDSRSFNWATASNYPGIYTVTGRLVNVTASGAEEILVAGTTTFTILPTPSVSGEFSLSKEIVIQGFDLTVSYTLTNDGNIDLGAGEVSAELIAVGSDTPVATYTSELDSIAILEETTGSVIADVLDIEPGDYMVKLVALVEGASFVIGELPLKVLPPLEVTKALSLAPRALVLLGKVNGKVNPKNRKKSVPEEDLSETILTEALGSLGAHYKVVRDVKAFTAEMRSGLYNLYVLSGTEPLGGYLDSELVERVNSGEGLILVNYETMEYQNLREATGLKSRGSLPAAPRTVMTLESPVTGEGGTLGSYGKVQRLGLASDEAMVAAIVYERGKYHPAVVLNPYGRGRVVTIGFDMAASAKALGQTAPYSELLGALLGYSAPIEVAPGPGQVAAVEVTLESFGASFELKVTEELSTAGVLLTNPAGKVETDGITWELTLGADEEARLLYLTTVPEEGGTYVNTTTVEYMRDGAYETYNTYPVTITAENVIDLEMRILASLESTSGAEEITQRYTNLLNRPHVLRRDIERSIHELLKVIDALASLDDDTDAIRLDLDNLLKTLQAKWVGAPQR